MMLLCLAVALAPPAATTPSLPPVYALRSEEDERQLLAKIVAAKMIPPGSYGEMMASMVSGGMKGATGAIMDMTPDELAGTKGDKKTRSETVRQSVASGDPHFEERSRIMARVMSEEVGRVTLKLEPKVRDALAGSMARRFSAAELRDINAFFATGTGTRFAGESMLLWSAPEITKASLTGLPEMMAAMPAIMKKVEEATAHLPKPKRKEAAKAKPSS